jgi:uncharacterized membrane protein YfcA
MNALEFTGLTFLGSLLAGFLGALTGLGGGVIIIPLLVLAFRVDWNYARGAALVSVIATSSGAAAAYVREGYTNLRVGMFLEMATTTAALGGAVVATILARVEFGPNIVSVIFGLVLIASAYLSSRPRHEAPLDSNPDRLAAKLRMDSSYPTLKGEQKYHVHNVPLGFGIMAVAGMLSGLLGIGSGAFKVLGMDHAMRLPFKVSTTTSNFMIGVTAAASAGVYLSAGFIRPSIAMPVMLGVLVGSLLGARVLMKVRSKMLRIVFGVVIFVMGIEMIYDGFTRKPEKPVKPAAAAHAFSNGPQSVPIRAAPKEKLAIAIPFKLPTSLAP